MKYCFLLTFFLSICHGLYAQKHDYVWVMGDDNQLLDTTFGGSLMDFNFNPAKIKYNYRELNLFVCNTSMCDSFGKFLFYTNGCKISTANDEIMLNGEDLNPGYVHNISCDDGYTSGFQSSLALLQPNSDKIYYLFHKKVDYTFNPLDKFTDQLLYSIIDMSANNGRGEVIAKNVEIMGDDIAFGEMTAVKHANGIDWWLVTPKDNSNSWYSFLFTQDGIVDTLVQTIGTPPRIMASGGIQICFSPDGSKLFRTNPQLAIKAYDFDRNNGQFTGFDTISVDYHNYPNLVSAYCAVSPNGRYLYMNTALYVFQFDLLASDVSASQTIVAEWDGFQEPIGTTFGAMQLGPDCKIYIATIDSKYYHVIHHPDEAGVACEVEQRGVVFPTRTGSSIPFFPNYRLGSSTNPGLPCTSMVGTETPLPTGGSALSVYPNPATESIKIIINQALPTSATWHLYDGWGRTVRSEALRPDRGICLQVDIRDLVPGLYFWSVDGMSRGLGGKIVVQH